MSNETIALTGATGFIGFAILQAALKDGYNVRIVVRSEAKAESLRSNPALKALDKSSQYTFYVVPDLSVEGALDEACAGADYIIHTASPLPFKLVEPEKQWSDIVQPAINNTISALESAARSNSIKRVVITSSCAVYVAPEVLIGPIDTPTVLTEDNKNAEIHPPYSDVLVAYVASKTSAFWRSQQWMADHKPAFDVVNVAPSYVMGRNELALTSKELFTTSNVLFLRMAAGLTLPNSPAEVASAVHIDDVVAVHLASLNKEKIPANDYLFAQDVAWNDVNDITKRLFPEAVEKGILPCNGNIESKPVSLGKNRTVETFGIELKSVDEMVKDLVGQYLELLEKEKAAQ